MCVHSTITDKLKKVEMRKEIYLIYCRTDWAIKENTESFYKYEIQLSSLIGNMDKQLLQRLS